MSLMELVEGLGRGEGRVIPGAGRCGGVGVLPLLSVLPPPPEPGSPGLMPECRRLAHSVVLVLVMGSIVGFDGVVGLVVMLLAEFLEVTQFLLAARCSMARMSLLSLVT